MTEISPVLLGLLGLTASALALALGVLGAGVSFRFFLLSSFVNGFFISIALDAESRFSGLLVPGKGASRHRQNSSILSSGGPSGAPFAPFALLCG